MNQAEKVKQAIGRFNVACEAVTLANRAAAEARQASIVAEDELVRVLRAVYGEKKSQQGVLYEGMLYLARATDCQWVLELQRAEFVVLS